MPTTKKNLLPAINALYDFGLTQDHFNSIDAFLDLFPKDEIEKNKLDNISNRLFYLLKTDKYVIETAVYLNHYREVVNHDIHIINLEDAEHHNLDNISKEGGLYFKKKLNIVVPPDEDDEDSDSYIKLNQITSADLPILEELCSCFDDNKYFESSLIVSKTTFNTVSDLIKDIKNNILKDTTKFNKMSDAWTTPDDGINAFTSIFVDTTNAKHTTSAVDVKVQDNLGLMREMSYIYDVYEENNFRIYKSVTNKYSYGHRSNDFIHKINILPHQHGMYNYIDVGRYYITKDNDLLGGSFIFMDMTPIFPTSEVMSAIYGNSPNVMTLVTNHDLKFATKRYAQEEDREKNQALAQKALEKKIQIKLAELNLPNGQLKMNDIVFKKDSFEYQGQEIKINHNTPWVRNLLDTLLRYYNFSDINFEVTFDRLLKDISCASDVEGTIGDVDFKYHILRNINKHGSSITRYEINHIRINQEEIKPCLERALCFHTQKDYDAFLKTVSACSLKMHHYLHNGLDLTVRDYFTNEHLQIKFPLTRKKNLNYLVIDKEKYQVHDTNKLLRLKDRHNDMLDIINSLISGDVVEGVTVDNLKQIIQQSKKAYEDAINKSKKLLEDAEKMFNLQIQEHITMTNITVPKGYIVKGKLRTYCIDASGKYDVYSYPDGKYLCMIDKTNTQTGFDKLVSRLYALNNDHLVSDQIDSLK